MFRFLWQREGSSVKWRRLPPNFDRTSFIIQWTIFALAFMATTAIGILGLSRTGLGTFQINWLAIDFQCFVFMVFSGLFGYVAGMSASFVVFLYALLVEPDNAYLVSIYLLAAILFSFAGQQRVFASKKKTLVFFLVSTFIMAILHTVLVVIRSYEMLFDLQLVREYWSRVVSQSIQCAAATYVCRLFFKYCPDHIKRRVALGLLYYNDEYDTDENRRRALRKNVISSKVTGLIMIEALILVTAAIGFTRILFPDLQRMSADAEQSRPPEKSETESEAGDGGITDESKIGDQVDKMLDEIASGSFVGFVPSNEMRDAIKSEIESNLPEISDTAFVYNVYGYAFVAKMVLMLFCVAVPVASIVNFYAQIRLAGPISLISDYMVRFANTPEDGLQEYVDSARSLNIRTHDEIEELYHAMDQTVHDMVDYVEKVKKEQQVEEDLRVAQRANEAKSSFLSNMSHEIRTPINAVLGMDEMILRESDDPATIKYATDIKNAGSTLLSLVNDILDFSKIEAGKMEILPVQYELSSTMNDLVNMIATRAADKGLELKVHVDEKIPHMLYGDEIRIKQCVTNVLTNAVKYTEMGSVTLNVDYRELNEKQIALKFQVIDTGIGIKEEDISKLFSPFERIEEIRNRTIEGTGLGMSIVKKTLAMMNTKLVVKSVYGEGSDFSFEVIQDVVDKEPIGDFEESYRRSVENAKKYQEAFHAPDAKVLIVDDTKMNLTVIRGLLKQTLLQVTTAESGKETLELVAKEKFDVILLDHRMPEMDGIETLAAMKELPGNLNQETPVLALTANAVSGAREMYLEAGFLDYLTKPIDAEKLEKTLAIYIPTEKLILPNDPRFAENSTHRIPEGGTDENGYLKRGSANPLADEKERQIHERLTKCEGIDLAAATKNCGSEDILFDAIKEFLIALPSKSAKIEEYAAAQDYRNYTVLVHALKSSARLIGAQQLSEDAAYLEQCGNDENGSEIALKTPDLLALYRSYGEKLAAVDPKEQRAELSKPRISEEDFAEALMGMKEFVEAYDFDSADKIVKMLDGYKLSSQLQEKYDKIKELTAAVDRDALLELL